MQMIFQARKSIYSADLSVANICSINLINPIRFFLQEIKRIVCAASNWDCIDN